MGVTLPLTLAAAGVGLVAGAAALLLARRPALGSSSILVWTALAGVLASLAAIVGSAVLVASDVFALAHLVYLIIVVALPIAGVAVGVSWWGRRDQRPLAVAAVILLLPVPFGLWATHVAPFRVHEDRVDLVLAPERDLAEPIRVGVLADLQTNDITGHERRAVRQLMAEEPDLVLIAGDFFQGELGPFRSTLAEYRALLGQLDAPGGVFAVRGDVDSVGFTVDELTEGTGIEVLDDEVVTTAVRGQDVVIGGVRLRYDAPAAQAVYDQLESEVSEAPVLLLSHRPDSVMELVPRSRVDLTVAGHTHGGQIALPFFGPPVTMTDVPLDVAAGGLHEIDGNAIYVSTGIGMERDHAPQVRFLTRPSFGIVELRPATG